MSVPVSPTFFRHVKHLFLLGGGDDAVSSLGGVALTTGPIAPLSIPISNVIITSCNVMIEWYLNV